jgi:hypothetical protein
MPAKFLLDWVMDNVNDGTAYLRGRAEARRLARRLVADAAELRISAEALEAAAQQRLPDFLYMAMEDAAALEACLGSPQGG